MELRALDVLGQLALAPLVRAEVDAVRLMAGAGFGVGAESRARGLGEGLAAEQRAQLLELVRAIFEAFGDLGVADVVAEAARGLGLLRGELARELAGHADGMRVLAVVLDALVAEVDACGEIGVGVRGDVGGSGGEVGDGGDAGDSCGDGGGVAERGSDRAMTSVPRARRSADAAYERGMAEPVANGFAEVRRAVTPLAAQQQGRATVTDEVAMLADRIGASVRRLAPLLIVAGSDDQVTASGPDAEHDDAYHSARVLARREPVRWLMLAARGAGTGVCDEAGEVPRATALPTRLVPLPAEVRASTPRGTGGAEPHADAALLVATEPRAGNEPARGLMQQVHAEALAGAIPRRDEARVLADVLTALMARVQRDGANTAVDLLGELSKATRSAAPAELEPMLTALILGDLTLQEALRQPELSDALRWLLVAWYQHARRARQARPTTPHRSARCRRCGATLLPITAAVLVCANCG